MNAQAALEQVKAELQRVNDQLDAGGLEMTALKAKKRQLVADRDDLQAFLDWKQAQP